MKGRDRSERKCRKQGKDKVCRGEETKEVWKESEKCDKGQVGEMRRINEKVKIQWKEIDA